jgi:hypothetical protein
MTCARKRRKFGLDDNRRYALESLRDLPDLEALKDAGMLSDGGPVCDGDGKGAEVTGKNEPPPTLEAL